MDGFQQQSQASIPTPSSPFLADDAIRLSLASYNEEVKRRYAEKVEREADQIREKCKTFAGFVEEAWHVLEPETRYISNWHIDAICEHLEAITWGRMKPRLIINVSPGSMKSLLVSVMWQAWMWGPCGMPGKRFLSTSFELSNVERDTVKTRDLIESDWYQALWPTTLTRRAALDFANSATGNRAGVAFSSLMGKRGDVLTIDDPHSLEGAESEVKRGNAVKRFLEGGKSRVNDRATSAIVIVMQRIHVSDLTGAVLAEDIGYEHLMIPMRFEAARTKTTSTGWRDPRDPNLPPTPGVAQGEGALMDPRRFSESDAADEEKQSYSWNGQYRQDPVGRDGNLFMVDRIEVINASPGGGEAVRGWDLAATKRKKSAWTVGVKLRRANGMLIIEDVKRIRGKPFEVKTLVLDTAIEDGMYVKQSIPRDPGAAGVHVKDDYAEFLEGHNFRFSAETGDKEFRAQGIASQVEAEKVVMVRAPWNDTFKDELRSFPNSLFKDQVDALSRAYMELLKVKELESNAGPEIVEEGSQQMDDDLMADGSVADPWGLDD